VQFGGGASISSVDAGDVHYISEYAHFDLSIGREVFVAPLGSDRLAIGLHRHGVGVTFRKSWLFATLSGGVPILNDFADNAVFTGGRVQSPRDDIRRDDRLPNLSRVHVGSKLPSGTASNDG